MASTPGCIRIRDCHHPPNFYIAHRQPSLTISVIPSYGLSAPTGVANKVKKLTKNARSCGGWEPALQAEYQMD